MRVAIVAESFLPNVNGVVNSVLRVLEHLRAEGHEALVIAPAATEGKENVYSYEGFRVAHVPAVDIPGINSLPIGVPLPRVLTELRAFRPDVVHLASPFVLGGAGAFAARTLGIPCVAVYQTDVAGFANNYRLKLLSNSAWRWTRIMHNQCALTLAPSSISIAELEANGVNRVHHWGRGVDAHRFHPSKRSESLREEWFAEGQCKREEQRALGHEQDAGTKADERVIVGFVGRLATEKSVERLAALANRGDLQLVIIGDGPEREDLERLMPTAVFTGGLYGEDLPRAYASLDIFVHTGQYETFCQAIQEAQASGLATIGPAAGGPLDLIDQGRTGFLLDVETFERDLPRAVDRILNEGLENYQKASYQRVQGKTWAALCDQLLGYYMQARRMHLNLATTGLLGSGLFAYNRANRQRLSTRELEGRMGSRESRKSGKEAA